MLFTALLYLWSVVGGIAGLIFLCEGTLPVKDNIYKTVVGVLCCGPIAWLLVGCALSARKLKIWLRE